jgi:glycerophosphoryl diester phosphodiesterase
MRNLRNFIRVLELEFLMFRSRITRSLLMAVMLSNVLPCESQATEPQSDRAKPKVIAHRGASGYCVEHSEGAKVLAHAQLADYIEQDVVLSKDRVFVVSHDITMAATTDVEAVFPSRQREDGKFYWADFTWEELRQVSLRPRSEKYQGKTYSGAGVACGQRVIRLDEEIALLRALDDSLGRQTGLYIELKSPAFHRQEFQTSMGELLIGLLKQEGIPTTSDRCLIQCFETDELEDLKYRLDCPYPLIQLLGGKDSEIDWGRIAKFAVGVGPALPMLAKRTEAGIVSTGVVEAAKAQGLLVHPYTVRRSAQPTWSRSLDETHSFLIRELRVDGFFTDFPDLGRLAVDSVPSAGR